MFWNKVTRDCLPSEFVSLLLVRLFEEERQAMNKSLLNICIRFLTMLHIWYVRFSNQFCADSALAIIVASLFLTTGWALRGFPNAFRWLIHLFRYRKSIRCLLEEEKTVWLGKEVDNVLQALLNQTPLCSRTDTAHGPSFVVEVTQHDVDTCIFFSQSILHRYLDIVKRDICRACCRRVTRLDRLGLNTLSSRD